MRDSKGSGKGGRQRKREEEIERVGGRGREGERRERNAEVDLDQECTVQWRMHGVYIADIFLSSSCCFCCDNITSHIIIKTASI